MTEILRQNAAAMAERDDVPGIANSLNWAADEIERLRTTLEGIAQSGCCETPGCSVDEPKCTTMEARAALHPAETMEGV